MSTLRWIIDLFISKWSAVTIVVALATWVITKYSRARVSYYRPPLEQKNDDKILHFWVRNFEPTTIHRKLELEILPQSGRTIRNVIIFAGPWYEKAKVLERDGVRYVHLSLRGLPAEGTVGVRVIMGALGGDARIELVGKSATRIRNFEPLTAWSTSAKLKTSILRWILGATLAGLLYFVVLGVLRADSTLDTWDLGYILVLLVLSVPMYILVNPLEGKDIVLGYRKGELVAVENATRVEKASAQSPGAA